MFDLVIEFFYIFFPEKMGNISISSELVQWPNSEKMIQILSQKAPAPQKSRPNLGTSSKSFLKSELSNGINALDKDSLCFFSKGFLLITSGN